MTRARKVVIAGIAAVVVLVLAGLLGPGIYARSQRAAPEPLSVDDIPTAGAASPSTAGSAGPRATGSPGSVDDDGTWRVGDDSRAGYRVDEILNNEEVTVVGRTHEVTGRAEVRGDKLIGATVEVDVASISTDTDRRDDYFSSRVMRTDEFPTATFELTEPVRIPDLGSKTVSVRAEGNLTLLGRPREVKAQVKVRRDGEDVRASGSIPVTFADWGIDAPDLGFVRVDETGQVEFLVILER